MSDATTTSLNHAASDYGAVQPDHYPRGFLAPEQLERLETWLDTRFRVPGTNMHFGLDGIIGLVPVAGDAATTAMSAVLIADAAKMGARKRTLARMAGNVVIDSIVGAIPVVGDLFDFAFKSNVRNLALHKAERERLAAKKR